MVTWCSKCFEGNTAILLISDRDMSSKLRQVTVECQSWHESDNCRQMSWGLYRLLGENPAMGPQWSPIRVERSSLRFHQRFSDTPRKTQLTFLNILNVSMLKDVFSASSVVYFCDLLCMWHDFVHLLMADQYFQYIYIYIYFFPEIATKSAMKIPWYPFSTWPEVVSRSPTAIWPICWWSSPQFRPLVHQGALALERKKNDVWNATGRLADWTSSKPTLEKMRPAGHFGMILRMGD